MYVSALVATSLSVKYLKVRVNVLGEDAASPPTRELQDEVRASPRVRRLLERHLGGAAGHAPAAYVNVQHSAAPDGDGTWVITKRD